MTITRTDSAAERRGRTPELIPPRWHWLIRGFRSYACRYVRKHFHAVRLSRSGVPFPSRDGGPALVVLNHSSWWDPMICTVLSKLAVERDHFAAIDAEALRRYPLFRKLGFVGVERDSHRGAAGFLRSGTAILARANSIFWVTAQGRFADARERPLLLQSGVGHLAARVPRGIVLPIAIEYAFWNERTPEVLVRIGTPVRLEDNPGHSVKMWLERIEAALTCNLDELNDEVMTRDPTRFETLLDGKTGVGGPYDWWRRVRSWARGERFDPSHEAAMRRDRP